MLVFTAIRLQWKLIQRYPIITACLLLLAATVIWFGNHHDAGHGHAALINAIGYIFAMWLCAWVIDIYALWKPAKKELPVREPRREFLYVMISTAIACISMCIRFSPAWETMPGLFRIAVAGGIFLCMYPVALAIVLLIRKYMPVDLGFRLNGFPAALAVYAITGIAAMIVAPHNFTWKAVLEESGGSIWGVLFTGFILAALPEEFFRMIFQTRWGAALHNPAMGWFMASLIWGLMHSPHWYGENKDMAEALLSGVRIVPLGLMWGYLTHRTQNMLPAILIHANNYWGLQNF
jgi:membrane protease YdiL (CAAX protease family)